LISFIWSVNYLRVLRAGPVSAVSSILRRHFLKEKEARELLTDFSRKFGVDAQRLFGSESRIERAETQIAEVYIINGKPALARSGGVLFPTLVFGEVSSFLPRVVVDMGAVSHVCGGADVMAPGVVRVEGDFHEGNYLLVVDERHGKPLAVGVALFDSQALRALKRGKVVRNVHHVGDRLWGLIRVFIEG